MIGSGTGSEPLTFTPAAAAAAGDVNVEFREHFKTPPPQKNIPGLKIQSNDFVLFFHPGGDHRIDRQIQLQLGPKP